MLTGSQILRRQLGKYVMSASQGETGKGLFLSDPSALGLGALLWMSAPALVSNYFLVCYHPVVLVNASPFDYQSQAF